jgi:hypothetical protein
MKYICIYIDIVEQVSRVKLNWNIPRTSLVNLLHTILYSILHFQKLQHWYMDSTIWIRPNTKMYESQRL